MILLWPSLATVDQAFGLTCTSRLGCQICLNKSHDNMEVTLPSATRNFYVVSIFYSYS